MIELERLAMQIIHVLRSLSRGLLFYRCFQYYFQKLLHENAYILLQRAVIAKAKPVLEENIKEVYAGNMFPECLKVADLGCSSGPNTLIVVSQMLDAIATTCTLLNRRPPAL